MTKTVQDCSGFHYLSAINRLSPPATSWHS
jgi:hypothetical protein